MIVVKNPGNRFFDEAYFIIKRGISDSSATSDDMVSEAERIVEQQSSPLVIKKKRRYIRETLFFALGILSGMLIFTVFSLLPV